MPRKEDDFNEELNYGNDELNYDLMRGKSIMYWYWFCCRVTNALNIKPVKVLHMFLF
jgi:hypothetical protein